MTKPLPWSRRYAILNYPDDQLVRVWTWQHVDAVAIAERVGWFTGQHPYADLDDVIDSGFNRAYTWMGACMTGRVAGYTGEPPVWAWLKRPNTHHKHTKNHSLPLSLVTALVPRARMLLSDHDLYHCILNGWPCQFNKAEWQAESTVAGASHPSWDRIFDLSPRTGDAANWAGQPQYVQACIDRIYWREVTRVRSWEVSRLT